MRAVVPSACSSRRARASGDGRHSLYRSRTGAGISIQRSVDTSWAMSAIGNSGARAAGCRGSFVPGCSGGGGAVGRSGTMLYQCVGMSDSVRTAWVRSLLTDSYASGLGPCSAGPSQAGSNSTYPAGVDLSNLRKSYESGSLDEAGAGSAPLALFQRWLDEAVAAKVPEPNAMTLATVGADGRPSTRIVLIKYADERGLVFFTNYESRKGRELAENPQAALQFHWVELERE